MKGKSLNNKRVLVINQLEILTEDELNQCLNDALKQIKIKVKKRMNDKTKYSLGRVC